MNDSEEVQRLIRLKRYESPGDEYFQVFLETFKDRQRSELLHRSARSLLAERVSMCFSEYNGSRWLVPTGAAAALLVGGLYFSGMMFEANTVPDQGLASSSAPSEISTEVPASISAPTGNEAISLQLPRPNNRVPGTSASALSGVQGLLPVGVRGTLREL